MDNLYNITAVLLLIACPVIYLTWNFFFNIYEVNIDINKSIQKDSGEEVFFLKAYAVNSQGRKLQYRNSYICVNFVEGKELIKIISYNKTRGELIFQSSSGKGKVIVEVNSKYSLRPSLMTVPFYNSEAV